MARNSLLCVKKLLTRFNVATLGKLFTHTCASVTKQYNLVLVMGCGNDE